MPAIDLLGRAKPAALALAADSAAVPPRSRPWYAAKSFLLPPAELLTRVAIGPLPKPPMRATTGPLPWPPTRVTTLGPLPKSPFEGCGTEHGHRGELMRAGKGAEAVRESMEIGGGRCLRIRVGVLPPGGEGEALRDPGPMDPRVDRIGERGGVSSLPEAQAVAGPP